MGMLNSKARSMNVLIYLFAVRHFRHLRIFQKSIVNSPVLPSHFTTVATAATTERADHMVTARWSRANETNLCSGGI
jgi:hypothetical protein